MLATALTFFALDCALLAAGVARLVRPGDGAGAAIPGALLVLGAGLLVAAKVVP